MYIRIADRETLAVLLLCALLLLAPLPGGSVTPAAQLAFRLAAFGLFLLAIGTRTARRRGARWLPACALSAVALLGFVQSCPWPAGAARAVSPEHVRLAEQAAEIRADDARPPTFVPLSLEASISRSAALSWLANAALLAAALVAGRRRSRRRWLLAALVAAALVQIGLGLGRLQADSAGRLAEVLLRPEGRLRGTFANPNHLSLFFEIVMAPVAAWTWLELSRFRGAPSRRLWRVLMPPLLWLALLAGVVLTGSRAGLLAAGVGLAGQAAAMPLAGRGRGVWLAPLLALLVGAGALGALGSGFEIRRYAAVSLLEDNLNSRMLVSGRALELWRRFPATGTGLGTFQEAFPSVATRELEPVLWNRAHNDPLELLVTGGAAGFALGLVALVALLPPIWRTLRRCSTLEGRAAGLAALGALTAAGVHELVDFGLVIPANAAALLAILGAGVAAGTGSEQSPAGARDRPAATAGHPGG